MTKRTKVVLDTNVYISGIVFGGTPRRLLDLAREGRFKVYASTAILLEVAEKLQGKFGWEIEKVEKTIQALGKLAKIVKPVERYEVIKADPSDDKIIECAGESKADYIVTGDKHLLQLKRWKRVRIIKPSDFWVGRSND